MMQWWKSSNKLSWHIEQHADGISLSKIALLPGNMNFGIKNLNCIVFQKIWCRYTSKLISDFSLLLLSSFLLLLQFQQEWLASDFKNWERDKLDKFCNLGDKSGIYPE